jgi:DNA-binding IclR family transcriptional regulator
LERYTERTWTDPHKVLERVLKLKELGYATITGEVDEGATAIAVPLVIRHGEIFGSLTIGMPEYRFSEEKERKFVPLLFEAAKEITKALDASVI